MVNISSKTGRKRLKFRYYIHLCLLSGQQIKDLTVRIEKILTLLGMFDSNTYSRYCESGLVHFTWYEGLQELLVFSFSSLLVLRRWLASRPHYLLAMMQRRRSGEELVKSLNILVSLGWWQKHKVIWVIKLFEKGN